MLELGEIIKPSGRCLLFISVVTKLSSEQVSPSDWLTPSSVFGVEVSWSSTHFTRFSPFWSNVRYFHISWWLLKSPTYVTDRSRVLRILEDDKCYGGLLTLLAVSSPTVIKTLFVEDVVYCCAIMSGHIDSSILAAHHLQCGSPERRPRQCHFRLKSYVRIGI